MDIEINEKNHLCSGEIDLVSLTDKYETPFYVIDENKIRTNYNKVYDAFTKHYPKFKIFYACKSNTNLSVMHILKEEGSGVDAVSPGEIDASLKVGFKPEDIIYTGNNVKDEELRFASDKGVRINIDSVSQLERLAKIVKPEDFKISFRINPMVGAGHHDHCITGGIKSKFGIMDKEAVKVYELAKVLGFNPVGIHTHIGSGILETEPFELAVNALMDIAGEVSKETDVDFEFIDFGGGLGIPYTVDEESLDIDRFAKDIVDLYKHNLDKYDLGEPSMYLEPGRYIVGNAGYLLTKVNTVKQSYRKFIGVDAGFNTMLRPVMYNSYHHIIVANKANEKPVDDVDIAGNICESGDLFGRGRNLPEIEEGDVLAIMDGGAYSYTMASRYNSRPLPAELLINNGEVEVIRESETFDDLYSKQKVPERFTKK